MSHEFLMPDIGEGLTEAEIIRWFVTVGDSVETDQILVEVETAKTVVEIPSPFEGTITSIFATEGTTIEVGSVHHPPQAHPRSSRRLPQTRRVLLQMVSG